MMFQFAHLPAKEPRRNRNSFSRTPKITFALPESVSAHWVTVGTIRDFQRPESVGLVEELRSESEDSLNNIALRQGLPPDPQTPQRQERVKGSLDPNLRGKQVEWQHRDMERPTAPISSIFDPDGVLVADPEPRQRGPFLKGFRGVSQPPGPARRNQNLNGKINRRCGFCAGVRIHLH